MISSVAGIQCGPLFGIYCSSKHALEGISDSLRMEISKQGISVSIIQPGYVHTNFALSAAQRLESFPSPGEENEMYKTAHREYKVTPCTLFSLLRSC